MNFRGARGDRDELDINLIPLIDVLLVILIFLHVIGALKHQFADRLPFIQRMWP